MSKQVLNGETAIITAQGQTITPNAEQVEALKAESAIVPELDMLANETISLKGIEKVDGKNAYVIAISDKKNAFFDTESGLKLKEETTQEMQGQSFVQAVMFSDYKEVNGVKFPFMMSQSMGPQNIEFTLNINDHVPISVEGSDTSNL